MLALGVGGGRERGIVVDFAGGKLRCITRRSTTMILTCVATARCDIFMTSDARQLREDGRTKG